MTEYDVRLTRLPASVDDEVDGWRFDANELAILRDGKEVVVDIDGDRYYVTAPITWAATFNSQVPALTKAVITAESADEAQEKAEAFRAQHVSAENCWRHGINIMPLHKLPLAWRESARPVRREKDHDVCAWEHAQAF